VGDCFRRRVMGTSMQYPAGSDLNTQRLGSKTYPKPAMGL